MCAQITPFGVASAVTLATRFAEHRRLGAFGTGPPPDVAVALSDKADAHDSTGLMSRQSLKAAGVRTGGWLIPARVPCAAFRPARDGITSCRPSGIPGAGFVLAQEFEGVMT